MVQAKGRPEVQAVALDIEAAIAVEQALLALAGNHRAEAQVAQVLLVKGWAREAMGVSMLPLAGVAEE